MLDDDALTELAQGVVRVPGVVAVALGGSRARGTHVESSDVDLGLYYRPPLDVEGLGGLARQVAGPVATVTRCGEWGPWVDGGGWLTIDGTAVDWIYRDLDRVRRSVDDAQAGRAGFHYQVGHPFGFADFGYAGELALSRLLADPGGAVGALQLAARPYPDALTATLVHGLWESRFSIDVARKAVGRADATYVAGCLFRSVLLCLHAMHGRAGRWLVNEKGAVGSAAALPGVADGFADRAHGVLATPGREPAELAAALDRGAALVAEAAAYCRWSGD